MTRQEFMSGAPFVIPGLPYDMVYTEIHHGGEISVSNGARTTRYEVERITETFCEVETWFTRKTENKIYFENCELK